MSKCGNKAPSEKWTCSCSIHGEFGLAQEALDEFIEGEGLSGMKW